MALLQFTNLNKHGNKRSRIIHSPTTQIGFNPTGFGSYIHVSVFKYKHEHPILPPGLVVRDDKKYLVPGWIEVHPETTLNDIIWKKPKIKKKDKFEKKTWTFKSSSSDATYTVTQVDSKTLRCSCPGAWRTKGNCKHVREVRESLTK